MKITIRSLHIIDVPGEIMTSLSLGIWELEVKPGNALKFMHAFCACGDQFFFRIKTNCELRCASYPSNTWIGCRYHVMLNQLELAVNKFIGNFLFLSKSSLWKRKFRCREPNSLVKFVLTLEAQFYEVKLSVL